MIAFLIQHREAAALVAAWSVREWATIKGLRGLKNFFLTGNINPPQPEADKKATP